RQFELPGPVDKWCRVRETIHKDVCSRGFDASRNTFTQSYGSAEIDASLLMLPLVGFLPPADPRVVRTVAAAERELMDVGLVRRSRSRARAFRIDGRAPGEGALLACSLWLADNYALLDRRAEACRLFERVLAFRNDVGLLAEEYDPRGARFLGNFPQAFSHVALIITALNLTHARGPAETRRS